MTETMAPQLDIRRFPPTERLGRRRQSRVHSEVVQQPIHVNAQQILLIAQHCLAEGPVQQAHVFQVKRISSEWNFVAKVDLGVFLRSRPGKSCRRSDHDNQCQDTDPSHVSIPYKISSSK